MGLDRAQASTVIAMESAGRAVIFAGTTVMISMLGLLLVGVAAAAIMVVVFGSFTLEDMRELKIFGLGLAVAVFLDATLVRLVVVPATMELLGDRNWWIPKWLDRMLPHLAIEPTASSDPGGDEQPTAAGPAPVSGGHPRRPVASGT